MWGLEYSTIAEIADSETSIGNLYSTPVAIVEAVTVTAGVYSKFPEIVDALAAISRFNPQNCHLYDVFIYECMDCVCFDNVVRLAPLFYGHITRTLDNFDTGLQTV